MNRIILLENSPHYAKEVDEQGNFIRFIKDPNKKPYKEICEELIIEVKKINQSKFVLNCEDFFYANAGLSKKQFDALTKIKVGAE